MFGGENPQSLLATADSEGCPSQVLAARVWGPAGCYLGPLAPIRGGHSLHVYLDTTKKQRLKPLRRGQKARLSGTPQPWMVGRRGEMMANVWSIEQTLRPLEGLVTDRERDVNSSEMQVSQLFLFALKDFFFSLPYTHTLYTEWKTSMLGLEVLMQCQKRLFVVWRDFLVEYFSS